MAKRMAGVIGWPVAHSLSPKLHGYWIAKYKLDAAYVPIPVEPQHLGDALKELSAKGFAGCNLTLPHKEQAVSLVDAMDDTARAIGAVNTIVIENGKFKGSNTDAFGFIENLKRSTPLKKKNKAVVLGAGGASRAVCKALSDEGYEQIILVNRTPEKAKTLAAQISKRIACDAWDRRSDALANADLLVNATSLGMQGKDPLTMNLDHLPRDAIVTDIVYTPLMTPLLVEAKKRGNPIVDGLGMLLYQAVPGFEAWFGVRPEVDDKLREHVLHG
jgi:shikimate dehydrogenase